MDRTQMAVNIFDKHAKLYQAKYMNVDSYSESLDIFCAHIAKEQASILELACGPGNITRYLLQKRPDFKILATDLAPNMLEIASIDNPRAEFQLMDCRDIGQIEKQYDGIMCSFCLPYLSKEESIKLIIDASKILKDSGILYLSTMEDNYSKSSWQKSSVGDEVYVYYHQSDYLTKALAENDFRIIDIRHQDYSAQDGTKISDLVIVAENKIK